MNNNIVSDLVAQKKYSEALDLCNESLQHDPKNAHLLADKAYVYAMQKLYEEALNNIDIAISITQEPVFYFNKARWLINKNDYNSVPAVLEKGIEVDKNFLDSTYSKMMFFLKAYAEMRMGQHKECLKSLSNIDDNFSIWIETQMWTKKDISDLCH